MPSQRCPLAIPATLRYQDMPAFSAMASVPTQAVLPLVIHYYGNKDAIHELDQITAMPFLAQSLFGHGAVPPFWCLHEWKAAADFAVASKQRPALHWASQTQRRSPVARMRSWLSPHASPMA